MKLNARSLLILSLLLLLAVFVKSREKKWLTREAVADSSVTENEKQTEPLAATDPPLAAATDDAASDAMSGVTSPTPSYMKRFPAAQTDDSPSSPFYSAIEKATSYSSGLIDNWDFGDSGLNAADMAPLMASSQPSRIVYYGDKGMSVFEPAAPASPDQQSDQTWYINQGGGSGGGTRSFPNPDPAKGTPSYAGGRPGSSGSLPDAKALKNPNQLDENAFEVVYFRPGKRNDGSTLVPVASSTLSALQGPDYDMSDFDWKDENIMRARLAKILSLGYGGELLLKVKGSGFIRNDGGADFALFSNATRLDNGDLMTIEMGQVGVSDSPDAGSFRWFNCHPLSGSLKGCAGVLPTNEGGDQFDLNELGLSQIRYIKIRDLTGVIPSRAPLGKWPTEGCDIDAISLLHAYKQ